MVELNLKLDGNVVVNGLVVNINAQRVLLSHPHPHPVLARV